MRYQYLLIDNDNTLMDFNAAEAQSLTEVLLRHHLPADAATVQTYHAINDAQWKALERGETTQRVLKVERFRQLLAVLGRTDLDAACIAAEYESNLGGHADLLPGAAAFIQALHGRMKIALVSNGVSSIQRGRLAKCPLTPLFDAIVISEEVGAAKPAPQMLCIALDMLGCTDRTKAVMMGDSLTADIPAAINAGVDSIYFSPKGKISDRATYCVATHGEAFKLLTEEDDDEDFQA
ncbi:MAG: YjjG family noncanonical pyrimidine nucleotidase [Aristaeellaceae bacterium]